VSNAEKYFSASGKHVPENDFHEKNFQQKTFYVETNLLHLRTLRKPQLKAHWNVRKKDLESELNLLESFYVRK
jgi:hypothetical protein